MFAGQQSAASIPPHDDHFDWQVSLAPVASLTRQQEVPFFVGTAFAPRGDVIQR
jgi:hypothetical protein